MPRWIEYCLICGGPELGHYDKNRKWLSDVKAIHKNGVTKKGKYDKQGNINIEGDNNIYCVSSCCTGSSVIPSFLVHCICLSMLENILKNYNAQNFYNIFKDFVNDNNYRVIKKNLRSYFDVDEEKEENEYILENPHIVKKLKTKKIIVEKEKYKIPNFLPTEIQQIIFQYFDYKIMCTISNVCYYWYILSINDKYWINIINDKYDFYEIENCKDMKELFKLYYLDSKIKDKIKNRKRIINCIEQINLIYKEKNHD